MLYDKEYPFWPAVLALSPPNLLPTRSLLAGVVQGEMQRKP